MSASKREAAAFEHDVDNLLQRLRSMSTTKVEEKHTLNQHYSTQIKDIVPTGIYQKITSFENGYDHIADLPMSKHDSRLFESLKQELANRIYQNDQLQLQVKTLTQYQHTFVNLNHTIDHQKQQIKELHDTILKQEAEAQKLKLERDKVSSKTEDQLIRDQKIVHVNLDYNELQSKYLILLENQEQFDHERQKMEDELQETLDKLEKSQKTCSHLRQDLTYYKNLDSKFTQMVQTNSELRNDIAKLKTEIERLNSLLATRNEDVDLLNNQVEQLKKDHMEQLKHLHEKHKHQLSNLRNQNGNYTDLAVANLQQQLDNERDKSEQERVAFKKRIVELTAENDALVNHAKELSDLCQKKQQLIDALSKDKYRLEDELSGLHNKHQDLNAKHQDAVERHGNEKAQLHEKVRKNDAHHQNQIGFLMQENYRLKSQLNEMTLDHKKDCDDLQARVEHEQQRRRELDAVVKEARRQQREEQERLKGNEEKERREHEKTMAKYAMHVRHLEDQLKVLNADHDAMQGRLDAKSKEHRDLEEKYQQLKRHAHEVAAHNGTLEKHLDDHRQKVELHQKNHDQQMDKINYLLNHLDGKEKEVHQHKQAKSEETQRQRILNRIHQVGPAGGGAQEGGQEAGEGPADVEGAGHREQQRRRDQEAQAGELQAQDEAARHGHRGARQGGADGRLISYLHLYYYIITLYLDCMIRQLQDHTSNQINDFRHHIGTMKTTQLTPDEFNLLCQRLTYQLDKMNLEIKHQTSNLSRKVADSLQAHHTTLPSIRSQSHSKLQKSNFTYSTVDLSNNKFKAIKQTREKYLDKPISASQVHIAKKPKKLIPPGHIHVPNVLPKHIRKDPFADPPPITDKDLQRGVYNLIYGGIIPKDVDISAAFKRGGDLLGSQAMKQYRIPLVDPKDVKFMRMFTPHENLDKYRLDNTKEPVQLEQKTKIQLDADMFLTSTNQEIARSPKKHHESVQMLIARSKVYKLELFNGVIQEKGDYKYFKVDYFHLWGAIKQVFLKLEEIASEYNLKKMEVDGHRIAMLADGQTGASQQDYLGCFCNQELIGSVQKLNKKQFLGRKGIMRSVVKLQSVIRMFNAFRRYKKKLQIIMKVIRIQRQFKLQQSYKNTVLKIQNKMKDVMSNQSERQSEFVANWPKIKDERRVEIHLPSYSIDIFQRLSMSHFRHREALSLTRLFAVKDPNIEMIFVSPLELNEEVVQYYWKVLEIAGVQDAEDRIHFVYPENTNRFPYSCSLTKLLYFSPKALFEIKKVIQNKRAYLVPMKVGQEEFMIAEYLKICVFSPRVELVEQVSKKSYSKELFNRLKVSFPIAPGCCDVKSKTDFIDKLTILISKYLYVCRWIFKIDTEFNGRGTASFTLDGIKQFSEIRKYTELGPEQVKIIRELVNALLPLKTTFAFPSLYPSFDDYLDNFLIKGGIIEAYPFQTKNQRVDKISSVNLTFLIEPQGQINYLQSSESVIINDFVKVGAVYPQSAIPNLNYEALIGQLGSELFKTGIYGYITLSLVSFSNMFWCKSLKIGLDEYVSAISLVETLANPGVSANNSMADVANDFLYVPQRCFMYLPLLYHPQLADNKYKDLFNKCRMEGIQFDTERKTGTLILLCDEIKSGVLSLMTIKENPRKAVKFMTDSLNFLLHFAGNVVKMQSDNLRYHTLLLIYLTRTDMFYFIDIVSKVRLLNKDNEKLEIKEYADKKILS